MAAVAISQLQDWPKKPRWLRSACSQFFFTFKPLQTDSRTFTKKKFIASSTPSGAFAGVTPDLKPSNTRSNEGGPRFSLTGESRMGAGGQINRNAAPPPSQLSQKTHQALPSIHPGSWICGSPSFSLSFCPSPEQALATSPFGKRDPGSPGSTSGTIGQCRRSPSRISGRSSPPSCAGCPRNLGTVRWPLDSFQQSIVKRNKTQ